MATRRTLDEGSIKVGDMLELTKERIGEVKFIAQDGQLEGQKSGKVFGVEIQPPALGKNDGKYKGTQYFTCPTKRGMFVQMDRIRRIIPVNEMLNVSTKLSKMGFSTNEANESSGEDYMLGSLHNAEALNETANAVMEWDNRRVKKWANEVLKGALGDQLNDIDGPKLLKLNPASLKALGFRPGQIRKLKTVMETNFGLDFGEN